MCSLCKFGNFVKIVDALKIVNARVNFVRFVDVHQIYAGDGIGCDALCAETNGNAAHPSNGQQRLDIEPEYVQYHQCSHSDKTPAGKAA